jgi:hypothetical protein
VEGAVFVVELQPHQKQNGGTTAAAFSGTSFSPLSEVHQTFDSQTHMRQFSRRSCH